MGTRLIMGLTVTALTVTACGGGGEDGLASGDGYSVLGALAELPPAEDDSFVVQTADLTAATELAGLERPEEPDAAAVAGWMNPLTGLAISVEEDEWAPLFAPPPVVTFSQGPQQVEEFDELAGWSLVDVDSYVEYSTQPNAFTVLSGEFDEATLKHLPEAAEGVRTVGEGEDLRIDPTAGSAVSTIGQPVRMAAEDGRLAVSGHTPLVERWLGDPEETLADHEGLAALAEALDEADVVSAMLSVGGASSLREGHPLTESRAPDAETVLDQLEARLDYLPDQAFDAVGVGWTARDGEPVIVVAYHFGDEAAAEASVEPLEAVFTEGESLQTGRPLAELFEVEQIAADGPVVVATLHAADPRTPHQIPSMIMSRDVPFLHQ